MVKRVFFLRRIASVIWFFCIYVMKLEASFNFICNPTLKDLYKYENTPAINKLKIDLKSAISSSVKVTIWMILLISEFWINFHKILAKYNCYMSLVTLINITRVNCGLIYGVNFHFLYHTPDFDFTKKLICMPYMIVFCAVRYAIPENPAFSIGTGPLFKCIQLFI